MSDRDRQSGFTLFELLIALVVFGLLLAGLAQATRFALAARDAQMRHVAAQEDLDAVDRTLRQLIGTIDSTPLPGAPPRFEGNSRSMGFTADLPQATSFAAWQGDVMIRVDPAHHLILRWAPHYGALIGKPPVPQTTDLLDDVDHIELSYWVSGGTHGVWVNQWQSDTLPELVRMRIVFPPEDRRHWPDIVAATGSD
jgi:general secretion pathway protein J